MAATEVMTAAGWLAVGGTAAAEEAEAAARVRAQARSSIRRPSRRRGAVQRWPQACLLLRVWTHYWSPAGGGLLHWFCEHAPPYATR